MPDLSARPATRRRRAPAPQLVGISLAYFMVLLDTTVLAVAEPDIMTSLHTDVVGVGWATTIYTMALASALIFGGSLADRYGAHRIFIAGVIGFGLSSLGCAIAPTLAALLGFRSLLGLFAAGIIPSSLSLIAGLYPDPARRGGAISAWAAISGVAMAAGPVLGGWLIAVDGWRAVFVINAPMTIVVLALCRTSIASARHARAISSLPHIGLAATLAAATLAVTQAGRLSWLPAGAFGLVAVGLAYGTTAVDRRSPAPLIPAALRRNRAVWTAFGWGAAVNYALTTVMFSIPLLLDTTAVAAGATLLPMTVVVALNPLITGRIVAARGPLRPIRLGFTAFPAGLYLVAVASADHHQPVVLAFGLLLCGLGVSWTLPALVGFAVDHARPDATGSVGGILNATRQVGATIAAAVASALLAQSHSDTVAFLPFLIAAAVCALGLVTAVTARSSCRTTCERASRRTGSTGRRGSGRTRRRPR